MSNETANTPRQVVAERITVGLVARAAEQLQRLQDRTGYSKTDLVNRAITLLEFVDGELAEGNELLLRRKESGETFVVKML
ncbi:hypothetical protein [Sphaerimonospora mesophila]|uniref:hypothetical protein n=1 Tax=Sphaerimonospora mesophila TaxID=37483 RepID=UPI0006E25AAE